VAIGFCDVHFRHLNTLIPPSRTSSTMDAAKASQVHRTLQDYASSSQMSVEMNLCLFNTSASLQLEGLYYGSPSAFNEPIEPFAYALGCVSWSMQTMDWIQSLSNYAYMSFFYFTIVPGTSYSSAGRKMT
jgi:hypothetical protein